MRKFLLAAGVATAVVMGGGLLALAQPYGPGMMGGYGPGNGYGPGYIMGPGYGHGWMMGGGYGPGMMGYGSVYERGYGPGPRYRGDQLCWKETDSARGYGYYQPCEK